jgi:hypothetical protein
VQPTRASSPLTAAAPARSSEVLRPAVWAGPAESELFTSGGVIATVTKIVGGQGVVTRSDCARPWGCGSGQPAPRWRGCGSPDTWARPGNKNAFDRPLGSAAVRQRHNMSPLNPRHGACVLSHQLRWEPYAEPSCPYACVDVLVEVADRADVVHPISSTLGSWRSLMRRLTNILFLHHPRGWLWWCGTSSHVCHAQGTPAEHPSLPNQGVTVHGMRRTWRRRTVSSRSKV